MKDRFLAVAISAAFAASCVSANRSPAQSSGLNTRPIPSLGSPEGQVGPKPMNLEKFIKEQNENHLKQNIGMEIELKFEKEVSIRVLSIQEGYIPVHGTFISDQGRSEIFAMALKPGDPLVERLRNLPALPVDTIVRMQVISSPSTYLVENITPPQSN